MGKYQVFTAIPENQALRDSFMRKVRVVGDCWEWTGSFGTTGYGQVKIDPGKVRPIGSHRAAWRLYRGDIPDGMFVCHHCDNRKCVRPSHLFLGDQKANIQDMLSKNRHNNSKKTHCPHGHPYSEANTQWLHGKWRYCVTCQVQRVRHG